jgi:hypothetical protein
MAKPMLVTWPFVFLLLDYWPLRRLAWQQGEGVRRFATAWLPLIREKLLLFGLVAASMIVTYIAQAHGGAVLELSMHRFPSGFLTRSPPTPSIFS